MDLGLGGKAVVVAGGSSGLGAAAVRLFVEEGARVVFTGVAQEEGLALQEALTEKGGTAVFRLSDISSEESVKQLADYVGTAFGGCDILFNNAGILRGGRLHETSVADWDLVQSVNIRGFFLTCRYFIPQMLKKGRGVIINTSSVSGLFGDYRSSAYNASKGAVTNLTRSLALDYAEHGIRVNAVCPGSMRTPMYDACAQAIGPELCERMFSERYPGHRIAAAEEVAKVVVFLASEASSFINGVNLPVDGGLTAHTNQPRFNL